MEITKYLKIVILGFCASLFVVPVSEVYSQPMEEEEEELQARPNPMERTTRGKARSWDPTDKRGMRGRSEVMRPGGSMRPGAQVMEEEEEPAQTMPNPAGRSPQMRGRSRDWDPTERRGGAMRGAPGQMQQMQGPQGQMMNPQMGGQQMNPQQMGGPQR